MKLSVVIPTYNRSDLLERALRGLLDQSLPADRYEIIVVDDGSTDATPQVVAACDAPPSRLRYLRQESRGPAAARNYGVREARGHVLLFTGDDCLPDSRLLEEHLHAHAEDQTEELGVIGYVTWHPDLYITPFMSFLEQGVQFGFGQIEDPENVKFWHFYTSNCSVPKRRLEEVGGFDEDFRDAAFEDTELAYRLHLRGLRLIYRPTAVTYHHHATTLERYLERQRVAGHAAVKFYRKHPELVEDLGIAHSARAVAAETLYRAMLAYAFGLGVREGMLEGAAPVENEADALGCDPRLAASGQDWIHEVLRTNDPMRLELERERYERRRLEHEFRRLEHEQARLKQEWERVTSRRLYRWSESLARATWSVLFRLGYPRRAKS